VAIRQRVHDGPHPRTALSQGELGELLRRAGRLDEASRSLEASLAGFERTVGLAHPLAWDCRHHAGALALDRGELERAASLFAALAADQTEVLGEDHPGAVAALEGLAVARYLAGGDTGAVLADALAVDELYQQGALLGLRALPENDALRVADQLHQRRNVALSLAADRRLDADQLAAVWEGLLRQRGLVLRELTQRRRDFDPLERDAAPVYEELRQATAQVASLVLRGVAGSVDSYREEVRAAQQRRAEAERRLGRVSASYRRRHARERADLDALRRALPERSALVSYSWFVRPPRTDPDGVEPELLALVLRADRAEPSAVPLGSSLRVAEAVERWRRIAAAPPHGGDGDATATAPGPGEDERLLLAGRRIAELAWEPVAGLLAGVDRVFLVPDGALHRVAFAALPGSDGRFLVERGPLLHVLADELELIDFAGAEAPAPPAGLVLVGDVDYDAGRAPATAAETPGPARAASSCAGGALTFPPLPGAAREVEQIEELWRAIAPGRPLVRLAADRATESAVREAARQGRWLHLATHSFSIDESCPQAITGLRAVGGLARAAAVTPWVDPLLLSGLALAGANAPSVGQRASDDGILSAAEVATLDLSGVEWAVLSGCDSGLGTARPGEGSFDLRRAFRAAGVRTTIASLWKVDDEAARRWMVELYRARLIEGKRTDEAVRDASLALLAELRREGASAHPFRWAAFVASGDWR
jgi:CHAT domain-containing protein/tetratricopeptide (TPR) repeat protein